jgi:hypothetical protein
VLGSKVGYTQVTRSSAATAVVTGGVITPGVVSISGSPTLGTKLTAVTGTWSPAPLTLTYQWKRDGKAISGGTKSTYTTATADLGKKITLTVTATRASYLTKAATTAAVTIGKALTKSPIPTVKGTADAGQKLTATAGTWAPATVTLAYQWKRGGVAIAKATAASYTLTSADAGMSVTVTVTGSKSGYTPIARTSAAVVIHKVLTTAPTPTISGSAKVGSKLSATPGTWAPAPVTLSYQWLRAGATIAKATGSTYTLVSADAGTAITVKVTGTKSGYTPIARVSAAVKTTR